LCSNWKRREEKKIEEERKEEAAKTVLYERNRERNGIGHKYTWKKQ